MTKYILLVICLLFSLHTAAGNKTYFIISSTQGVDYPLSRKELRKIFLLKQTYWSTGVPVKIVIYPYDNIYTRIFYIRLGITSLSYSSVYTSGSEKRVVVNSEVEAINYLRENPGSIGFSDGPVWMFKDLLIVGEN